MHENYEVLMRNLRNLKLTKDGIIRVIRNLERIVCLRESSKVEIKIKILWSFLLLAKSHLQVF